MEQASNSIHICEHTLFGIKYEVICNRTKRWMRHMFGAVVCYKHTH